jgi:1,4-dihydroxy-2-naphthoate polyprenyltransferase
MSDSTAVTRRDVWVSMLLYPAHTLPTAAAPVLVACGLAVHNGVFSLAPAAMAFIVGWLIQLGGVVTDNYVNLTRHADDREHAAFVYALKAGLISMSELRLTIVGCYLGATLVALRLVYLGGLPVVIIGLVSIAASLAYSTGPLPLGDNAMGDPLFFAFFGLVSVGGAYYVQGAAVLGPPLAVHTVPGLLTGTLFIVSLPMAALTTNILIIDNIRDLEYDQEKREHTIAVLIGPSWSRVEYVLLLVLAYAVPVWLWTRDEFRFAVLLPLLSLPLAVLVARDLMRRQTHESLIPMTPRAAQVALLYGVLFAAGLAVR